MFDILLLFVVIRRDLIRDYVIGFIILNKLRIF